MKITVAQFASGVEEDYGAGISAQFLDRFPNPSTVISFKEGLDHLDQVLQGSAQPAFPSFGRPNSLTEDGVFEFKDLE